MARVLARQRAIEKTIPLLEAIGGVAEIALHHASGRVTPAEAYANAARGLLSSVVATIDAEARAALWPTRTPDSVAVVVISSERGLCGPFNARVIRAAGRTLRGHESAGTGTDLICLGEKARRLLTERGREIAYSRSLPSLTLPTYVDIERIALDILDLARTRGYGHIEVVRHVPGERLGSSVVTSRLWPPSAQTAGQGAARLDVKPLTDAPALIAHLLAEDLLMGLYEAVVESFMSEQQARVVAMRLAKDNAQRIVDQLTWEYRAARQNEVTSSLLEVLSGYEAAARDLAATSPQSPG